MIGVGEPETISDKGATIVWDGRYLPGIWLVDQAVDLAVARASDLWDRVGGDRS